MSANKCLLKDVMCDVNLKRKIQTLKVWSRVSVLRRVSNSLIIDIPPKSTDLPRCTLLGKCLSGGARRTALWWCRRTSGRVSDTGRCVELPFRSWGGCPDARPCPEPCDPPGRSAESQSNLRQGFVINGFKNTIQQIICDWNLKVKIII